MTDTLKRLAQGTLPSSAGTLYTVPGATSTIVKKITLANPTGTDRTARLTNGGTADANVILPAVTIPAGGFAEWEGSMTLAAADTISGVASAATAITYSIYGDEVS